MSIREFVLIVDDDRNVTDALTMLLDRPGLTTFICSDVESAEIVLAAQPITRVLSDVQFSGPFSFEGLHFLSRLRVQRPSCPIVLMTGHSSDDLRTAAYDFGARAVLAKPFGQADLEMALALPPADPAGGDYETVRVATFDEILRNGLLTTVFQPIVGLHRDSTQPLGYEALTRVNGWAGGVLELFDYASRKGRLAELNLAAIECAMSGATHLGSDALLFINVDPLTFDRADFVETVIGGADRNGLDLSRLVLEVTERSGFGESGNAVRAFAALRAGGVRFALDDHGSAHSHLSMIADIRPAFIKISHSFGTGFEEDSTRLRIVRNVLALARDFDCRTVLEGIETEATARAAVEFGIELGQGYFFGRPNAATHWISGVAA